MAKVIKVHGRRKTNLLPPKKQLAKVATLVKRGYPVVKYANENNYNPAELAGALKDMGVPIRRGPKGKMAQVSA
jgi:hypothetical protein